MLTIQIAHTSGFTAASFGFPQDQNPFPPKTPEHYAWADGWNRWTPPHVWWTPTAEA